MKKVGNCYYVHKSCIRDLFKVVGAMEKIKNTIEKLPIEFNYDIIKYNSKKGDISFIISEDWDIAKEPRVGNSIVFNEKNPYGKLIKEKGQIYHHKWCFVSSEYQGFDVEESKKRSQEWMPLMTKEWRHRIGFKKYWIEFLKENNLEV